MDVQLTSVDPEFGEYIQFFYVTGRAESVAQTVADSMVSEGWTDEVPSTPWLLALLGSLIPLLIILALFWFFMSSMAGIIDWSTLLHQAVITLFFLSLATLKIERLKH